MLPMTACNSNKWRLENFTAWNKVETWKLHNINSHHLQLHFCYYSWKPHAGINDFMFTKVRVS